MQYGWILTFSGQLDIAVGDTITSNDGSSGTVSGVSYDGVSTIVTVDQMSDPLGVTYTRTRATLAAGQIGAYTTINNTFWDSYDMIGTTLFAGLSITKRAQSFRILLRAQYNSTVTIQSVDTVVMGIR
jgi:hypothetical protein